MNIKNEIKLFEKHAQKFFTTNEAFTKENDNYIYDEVKFMWDCWIKAKQQAVPEGFAVVPVEPTKPMQQAAFDVYEVCDYKNYGLSSGTEVRDMIYKVMIQEAQK